MSGIIEISEIDLNTNNLQSSNFGGGLEFLMNDKIKPSSSSSSSSPHGITKSSSSVQLEDVDDLESEINAFMIKTNDSINIVDNNKSPSNGERTVQFQSPSISSSSLGNDTANSQPFQPPPPQKTWDGFTNINNVQVNPEKTPPTAAEIKQSNEDSLREKYSYLNKLKQLAKKVELTKEYTMESSLSEMKCEYESHMDEKRKENSIKFQGNMLMAIVNGIEFINTKLNPFDIQLDGWGEQINENITDYDAVFAALYDKYKGHANVEPELQLLFQLGGSAMMVHMTNTMFKTSMPGMDDILRQNPDLVRSFQNAAANSISQTSPGLGQFMSNMLPPEKPKPESLFPPASAQQPSTAKFFSQPSSSSTNNNNVPPNHNMKSSIHGRPEMRGPPTDIENILMGLKTKSVDMNKKPDGSTISIGDLKELQESTNMPKKSKRGPKPKNNTISLDI
jgi:hypothetical protein